MANRPRWLFFSQSQKPANGAGLPGLSKEFSTETVDRLRGRRFVRRGSGFAARTGLPDEWRNGLALAFSARQWGSQFGLPV